MVDFILFVLFLWIAWYAFDTRQRMLNMANVVDQSLEYLNQSDKELESMIEERLARKKR